MTAASPSLPAHASRPVHPVIVAVKARDKALRAAGKRAGLWTALEAGEVMQMGETNAYHLMRHGLIECTNLSARGRLNGARRITSNGIIAFIEANTTGPDEALVMGNLIATAKTLGVESITALKAWCEERLVLMANGVQPNARKTRTLALAVNELTERRKGEAEQMEMFAEARMTNAE